MTQRDRPPRPDERCPSSLVSPIHRFTDRSVVLLASNVPRDTIRRASGLQKERKPNVVSNRHRLPDDRNYWHRVRVHRGRCPPSRRSWRGSRRWRSRRWSSGRRRLSGNRLSGSRLSRSLCASRRGRRRRWCSRGRCGRLLRRPMWVSAISALLLRLRCDVPAPRRSNTRPRRGRRGLRRGVSAPVHTIKGGIDYHFN